MGKYALLSASGSARWLACPPSARLEEKFPKSSNAYADEGTAAHELSELAARYALGMIAEKAYKAKLAKLKKGQYFTAEMMEHAMDYGMYIGELVDAARAQCPDALVELEATSLDFSRWAPEGFGTCDCIIVADDVLEVIDFKYGKGVAVSAEGNTQMRLYALGAIMRYGELFDIKRVRMTILQPRINNDSTDELTAEELMAWAEDFVKPRAALAFAGEGEFSPSDKACKFCRVKAQCKARYDKNLALFDDAPDLLLITPEEAGSVLERAGDVKAWLTDLENFILKELFAGNPVEGWKLVEGRSDRKYVDEDKVAKALTGANYAEDDIYERKLLGITAMEKAVGKKKLGELLEGLIYKPPGKPTLAQASDTRAEFKPEELILEAFDDVEE